MERDRMLARTFRAAGIACVAIAVVAFALGLVVYLGGNEVAVILMMLALGPFVLGIGFLAAARRGS